MAGAPVFSLVPAAAPAAGAPPPPDGVAPVWCGLATKEIASWVPGSAAPSDLIRMNGHTGWVRALATSGRWLFSSGCNHLRQWDTTYTIPKEVASHALFTGDILALAATKDRVFTAGADGSVRAWAIGSKRDGKEGEIRELAGRDKAHDGRVTALAVAGRLLFSVSYDGRIKVRARGRAGSVVVVVVCCESGN